MLTDWYQLQELWTMPTEDDEERPESIEEPRPEEPRSQRMLSGKAAVVGVVAASVATAGVVVATLVMDESGSAPNARAPLPTAVQPLPTAAGTTQPVKPAVDRTTQPAKPPVAPPIAMDDRGFVDSTARCEGDQSAVAIGRTNRSVVVVCKSPNNRYQYNGMRLSDRAALQLNDVRVTPQGFEARGDGAKYLISATELVAMSRDAVLTRDPMLEYRTPKPNR
jgi:hypothetical protein